MELTSRDERVLAVLAFRGDASLNDIANELKMPLHLVRGSVERLKRQELILPRLYLDLYRVGLTEFSFYFSLVGSVAERQAALDDLLSRPGIAWAVELLGDFEFACSGYFQSIGEFQSLLQQVYDRHPGVIQAGTVGSVLSLTDYGFAGGRPKLQRVFRYGDAERTSVALDEMDWRILGRLSASPGEGLSSVARFLRAPLSTVSHRVQQLKASGVIQGIQYLFNFSASNFRAYRMLVTCVGSTTKERELLKRKCLEHPLVYFMVSSVGSWDFTIGAFARAQSDIAHLKVEVQELFASSGAMVRILADSQLLKLSPFPFSEAEFSNTVESLMSKVS